VSGTLEGESGWGLDADIESVNDEINNLNEEIFDLEKSQSGASSAPVDPEATEKLDQLKRDRDHQRKVRSALVHKRETQRHPPQVESPGATPQPAPSTPPPPTPPTPIPDGGPVLEVVDATGHPLTSIAKDTPFWVRVHNPPGAAVQGLGHGSGVADVNAASVTADVVRTVTLQVGQSTSTFTMHGSSSDPLTFVTEPIVLGGPVGVPDEGVISEPVTVTFTGSTGNLVVTGDAYRTAVQQAWQATSDTLSILDAYWRQIAIGLRDVKIDETTDAIVVNLKRQSLDAVYCLDAARSWLNNPNELTSTQVAMAQVCLDELRGHLVNFDQRTFNNLLNERREVVRDQNSTIYLHGLCELSIGFYQLVFTMVPFASSLFTLVTGQSITGEDASRLEAIGDLALQAAGTVAAQRFHVMDNVARRAQPLPRTRVVVAKRPTGKEPSRGIPEGTAVRPEGHGMLPEAARQVNFIAEDEQVIIQVRGTNIGALADRAAGHPGKPMLVKPKTINELDIHLGASPEAAGHAWVGYFEPQMPPRTPGMSDAVWNEITARFTERTVEFADCRVKMAHLVDEGLIRIEQGVVIDTGVCGGTGTGLPITGDYDLWRITNLDGTPLSPERLEGVLNRLKASDFHAEHGCHTDWVIDPTKMSEADFVTNTRVDQGVRAKHAPGKDSLIVFRGLSRPTIAGYEHGLPGPTVMVTRPLIPDGLPTSPRMPGADAAWSIPNYLPVWLTDGPTPPPPPGTTGAGVPPAAGAGSPPPAPHLPPHPHRTPTGRRRGLVAGLAAAGVVVIGAGLAIGLSGGGHTDTNTPGSSAGSGAAATGAGTAASADGYTCQGGGFMLFDNWNKGRATNGGFFPTFSTDGKAYCFVSAATYHWNDGKGSAPGTIAIERTGGPGDVGSSVSAAKATPSSGQNDAPDVNWIITRANYSTDPLILDGSYKCVDSDPATWSLSGGAGFCWVEVTTAVKS
jgi:hypothetical protein